MKRMSEHTGLISSYQLLITAACTNTGSKMKGSHSRAADRCPFVPRHSLSQVTSFMQLGMLCMQNKHICLYFLEYDINLINSLRPSDAFMRQQIMPSLGQIMACRLIGAKPLSEPMLSYCQLGFKEYISVTFYLKFKSFHSWKCTGICHHFVSTSMC